MLLSLVVVVVVRALSAYCFDKTTAADDGKFILNIFVFVYLTRVLICFKTWVLCSFFKLFLNFFECILPNLHSIKAGFPYQNNFFDVMSQLFELTGNYWQ